MSPRSRYARPAANRIFTNREGPIARFAAARADLPPDRHRILGFHGVGGTGKTALCRKLRETLRDEEPRRQVWGHLDFAVESLREPARGLLQLRRSLAESGPIRFSVFDVAILTYWGRAYPGEDPARAFADIFGEQEGLLSGLADKGLSLLDQAQAVSGLAGAGFKLLNYARRKLKERNARQACEALNGLEHLDATDLLDRLPWFLAQDLCAHRAAAQSPPNRPAPPPVIFLDSYETLWSDRPDKTGAAALETDAWVRELVAAAPGCLFVCLGRERLGWDRRFPDQWAGYLADQHPLGGLAEPDAQRYLEAIPIPDPLVRRAIIDGATAEAAPGAPRTAAPTTGAHPFYLDLAVDTWLDLTAAGRTPAADDFGATHPEVLARFLRQRSTAEIATLECLAGPNAFDRDLFAALVQRFSTGYPLTAFADLMGFSFCEPGADGRYRLHGLMREHLLEELDPATKGELSAFLFDWFDARCRPAGPREVTPGHEEALREAVQQRGIEDAGAALEWFSERAQVFYEAARFALLEPLDRWSLDLAEQRLGPDHARTAVALNNLAQLLQDTNRLPEAEPLIRRALAIDEAGYGPDHPNVTIRLNNLAALLWATNRLPEAEPLMRRALAIDEAGYGPDHPNVAIDLNNLAQLLPATIRLPVAEALMRRALAIDEAGYGPNHPNVARHFS
uniref:tetratricopeptide repeat protein n=1 Tax=uncultured Thiodictyon sp. TaxID=1846217 RepID=UPI0025F1FAB2